MRWRLTVIIVTSMLLGCAQPKPLPVAEAAAPNPVIKKAAPKPAAKEVVILVSENIPAYNKVAQALAKQLGARGSIRYMNGSQVENIRLLSAYKNDEKKQLVSIGPNASVAAKTLTNTPVVFCQVFNYQDYGLLTDRHKGVSMVPIAKTFATWRALAPGITDVGVISGPGQEDMIGAAIAIAKKQGIVLHHKIVSSDNEYQYAYKEMVDEVQGYWLLPDNRVLSGSLLNDVMAFSVRNSKQVVVFSDELLNLGGLFSVTSDPQDIAQQVLERLEQAQDTIPGGDIAYLDKAILRINPVMAQRLNLRIPKQYQRYEKSP